MPATPLTTAAPGRAPRTRRDRCPGVLRPWPAEDGLLVRLRLRGGRLPTDALRALLRVAETYGDARIHVTGRANLQVRGLPGEDGRLSPAVEQALLGTGLIPSLEHDLARNLLVSPQTGMAGGRSDLRPLVAALDERLCGDPRLAALPGRFLFVLDDGRGDLLDRSADLGLVALDSKTVQLRVGDGWGPVVARSAAVAALLDLARDFLEARGTGRHAAWHVAELPRSLAPAVPPDSRLPARAPALPFGPVPGGRHVAVPEEGVDRAAADALVGPAPTVVVTPWRGLLVPEGAR